MNSIDIFPWNENFNTGLPEIDVQHQKLVQLLNRLASHSAFQPDVEQVDAVFDELADYALYHFRTEEAVWHQYFPGDRLESDHRRAHADFVSAVGRLKAERSVNRQDDVLGNILLFLTRWLASHILNDDRYLALVVLSMQSGLPKDQAEEQAIQQLRGTMRVLIEIILSAYYALTANTLKLMVSISELRRAEQELRIAAIAFEAQEGIVVTDARGVIMRVNRAFGDISGYTAEDAVGRKLSLLDSGHHDAQFYRKMRRTLLRARHWQGEIWNRRKNGEVHPGWLTISAVTDAGGRVTHYVSAYSDITQHKKDEAEIHSLAFFDQLTGLPNRRLLLDRLQQTLASSARHRNHGAVLFIDLDNFKTLNDTKGHRFGDLLLVEVAARLQGCVREGDTVARPGGDEFLVILDELSEHASHAAAQAEAVADKILHAVGEPCVLREYRHHCSASIGIALFRNHDATLDELLKHTEIAMYEAKNAGRNTLRFYDHDMQAALEARTALEQDLRQALAEDQFRLHYQMQAGRYNRILGAEVLIRWQHPRHGLIHPAQFIPLAEETGLILLIGEWVLQTACAQLKAWEAHPQARNLQLAVNVSARQFHQPDFVEQVCRILRSHDLNPNRLKLELTESLVLDNIDNAIVKMQALRELGVRFSMDDFGTGYSSLSYLTRLPLDQLKIDQSFVRNIGVKPTDAVIVQTIIGMAGNLGMEVIAEGVETEDQRAFLERHGCEVFQGYLFGRPVPVAEFEARLAPS